MARFEDQTTETLTERRNALARGLAGAADFTPGTLQEEWGRCGKPGCRCHQEGDPGHGPRYSLMRYEQGRPVKRKVPARLADQARARTEAWAAFKSACAEIADVNAELSRRWLAGGTAPEAATCGQRGGFGPRPRRP
ncbi:MAG: hypothetical protein LBK95_12840 [Bifidobacteriaceae bacterium]|nr:hypothetical protein [Bifidobacteriaceae bacterium]